MGPHGHTGRSHLGVHMLCNRTQCLFHNVTWYRLRNRLPLGVGVDKGNLQGRVSRKKMHRPPCTQGPPKRVPEAGGFVLSWKDLTSWGLHPCGDKCESSLITENRNLTARAQRAWFWHQLSLRFLGTLSSQHLETWSLGRLQLF